jgi:predicted helicase
LIHPRNHGGSVPFQFSDFSISDFRGLASQCSSFFAAAGQKLADLHINYESAKEYPLKRQENKDAKLNWRVESMKLAKDKSSLFYNDFLTLLGIPRETYDYRLGNRSALEWVIDQYRVTRDPQGNIISDPNRLDDEQYILRLIAQVTTVSLETMKLVRSLPEVQFE